MFKRLSLTLALVLGTFAVPHQTKAEGLYQIVNSCNSVTLVAGQMQSIPFMDIHGNVCTTTPGGGSSVTISSPIGTGAASTGVTVTLDSTDAGNLATTATNSGLPLPAGTAIIGKVGIDQTTPGTTNAVQHVSLAPVNSTAAEACHVLKASAGLLLSVEGYGGQAEWVMVFNATSAPADGAVTPVSWGYLGAAGAWSMQYLYPLNLSTGVTVCYSSTGPFSKTAISTNNAFSGQVQ